jgi:dTDP-4-dehydrorhamnose reductase|tara:strand:- start:108 stop:974 length:867 start_codon:yes stop_codon:yes gene_type:complete
MSVSLIIGVDGLIGSSLYQHLLNSKNGVIGTTKRKGKNVGDHLFLDLSNNIADWQFPKSIDTCVFCAGVTNLELCEENPSKTSAINVDATLSIIEKLGKKDIHIIFLSSNLVFDGLKAFKKPDDELCPKTEYGRQKAMVEKSLKDYCSFYTIVRISKILYPNSPFFASWGESLHNGEMIHPFNDKVISPIPLNFIVKVLKEIIDKSPTGIFQISGDCDISYAQAALWGAEKLGYDLSLIDPISVAQSSFFGHVPENTTLNIDRIVSELNMIPPSVRFSIEQAFPNNKL